ncbi:glutamate-cysteine ligase family protein [Piscinibacter sakaiensis]|uniref:glutamate-cysteine ligase family protein n=1 Tax=Piscinibacter sakaiensis TaxID=1547922 RepID=UPI003AACD84E
MGQDIAEGHFRAHDFATFARRLRDETAHLHALVERGALSRRPPMAGLELEAWLIDSQCRPAPCNDEFLQRLGSPDVVTELAKFNIEMNVAPQPLAGSGLARLAADLQRTWQQCQQVAGEMGLRVAAIGSLPTLVDADLALVNMSDRTRYQAINEQVLRSRGGRPIRLDIEAADGHHLVRSHADVMLEAGATSLQAHLQVAPEAAARAYNASLIASAATVAISANAPFLFGQPLWEESRIALFEQAIDVGARPASYRGDLQRVSFGSGYVGFSMLECFAENVDLFDPLLPIELDEPADRLPHLRLHNGTIWRWNRPLVGFDDDGTPHLRIEHRPMSAGPSITDMIANIAFYYGLTRHLADADDPPELHLPFTAARDNFYQAARLGLAADVQWLAGQQTGLRQLILDSLIDAARAGLASLQVDPALADRWLRTIEARVETGRTGAHWQRAFVARHGADMARLTREYTARQADGAPVHEWTAG